MPTHLLDLYCSQCGARVVRYRKEGTGRLVRLYLERILAPESPAKLKQTTNKSDLAPLTCPQCGNRIGMPMIHEGTRPAYRLIKGSFRRKRD